MPKSPRETIKSALESCITLHEKKEYEAAEIVLRQTSRVFSEYFYTDTDVLAKEQLEKGMEYLCAKDVKHAIENFEESYALQPDSRAAFINCIYCNFHLGKYERVWELYEDRLKHFDQLIAYKKMFDPDKKWDGIKSIQNKKVLVFCEQGLGDTIHFSRYLKHLKSHGCDIVLNCADVLKRLFQTDDFKFIVDDVITKESVSKDWMPDYDFHLPIMSLPYLLKMPNPTEESYIHGTQGESSVLKNSKLKIGFTWKGNPASGNDKIRSVNINWFRQLKNENVELHGLHNTEPPVEGMIDHTKEIEDFYDLAVLIKDMDLIVSVDTALLHLAGAMGKRAWGLLPFNCDWRWRLDGNKTLWYPNIKLFRQEYPDDWEGVFNKVKSVIKSLNWMY